MKRERKNRKKKTPFRKKLLPLIGLAGAVAVFSGMKSGFKTAADFPSKSK